MDASGRHIAFFSFPGFGHVRPTLPVVRDLVARGHRVSYVVAERFGDVVADTGARTIRYRSSFPASVPAVRTADDLAAVAVDYLREGFAALPDVWDEFTGRPPDLVVEDALSTAVSRLTAQRSGCPVVRTFAGFAGNEEVPLNGSEPEPGSPHFSSEHPAITAFYRELLDRLGPYGLDAERIGRIVAGGEVAANLVFVPKAFQPRAECFDDSFVFVGPGFDEGSATTRWEPRNGASSVVLISLGTSANSNPGFFRGCAEAFAGTDWHVVMTVGGHIDPVEAAAMPENVESHAWLDYGAVLPYADVVVCQAGAGTLMDAFGHGIPVVVVPQQPDARVMAKHVERLGLGRALFDEVTGAAVRAAVAAVVADGDMARRAELMRAEIRASGGAKRAADVLDRIAAGFAL